MDAQVYNTSAVILMATGGASGGGYVCSQGLLYGIYVGLLIMHGLVNSFGGSHRSPPCSAVLCRTRSVQRGISGGRVIGCQAIQPASYWHGL